jgi:uncharacterized MAPEG superfamily protein
MALNKKDVKVKVYLTITTTNELEKIMTTEILILLAVLLFLFVLTAIQVVITMANFGTITALKGRDNIPYLQPGIGGRLHRAIANLREGLHIFTPLILLTAILGISNDHTVVGAQIYLIARLLHTPLYLLGVAGLRTGAFALGVLGLGLITWGLFAA